jgi:hypothetical protein
MRMFLKRAREGAMGRMLIGRVCDIAQKEYDGGVRGPGVGKAFSVRRFCFRLRAPKER